MQPMRVRGGRGLIRSSGILAPPSCLSLNNSPWAWSRSAVTLPGLHRRHEKTCRVRIHARRRVRVRYSRYIDLLGMHFFHPSAHRCFTTAASRDDGPGRRKRDGRRRRHGGPPDLHPYRGSPATMTMTMTSPVRAEFRLYGTTVLVWT